MIEETVPMNEETAAPAPAAAKPTRSAKPKARPAPEPEAAEPTALELRRTARNRRVNVRLPRAEEMPDSGQFVSVNSRRYMVPRGREVSVPYEVYRALQISADMDEATFQRLTALSDQLKA